MSKIRKNIMIEPSVKSNIERMALEESLVLNKRVSFSQMLIKLAGEAIEIRDQRLGKLFKKDYNALLEKYKK